MRHAIALAAAVLIVTSIHVPAQPPATEQAVQSLFNGKDLTGWDGDPQFWSVRDGAITGQTTAEKPAKGNTFLIWTGGVLKDFELRISVRLENHNTGIQFRSKDKGKAADGKRTNWVVGGYQADMDGANKYTGMLYEEGGRGIITKPGQKVVLGADGKSQVTGETAKPADIQAAIKVKDWNEVVIIAQGNHIVQKFNGIVTVDVTDDNPAKRAMEGILALQLHAGPPMLVQFKDITLKELK
jgi:hypothetical protein